MDAITLWRQSGLQGSYQVWEFGDQPDELAELVRIGRKTATSSAYPLYAMDGEVLPRAGEYSIVLNSAGEAVCIIRTTKIRILPFREVSEEFAAREGEGDRTLSYWRDVHRRFFTGEMEQFGLSFREDMLVVCEEFEKVYP